MFSHSNLFNNDFKILPNGIKDSPYSDDVVQELAKDRIQEGLDTDRLATWATERRPIPLIQPSHHLQRAKNKTPSSRTTLFLRITLQHILAAV